MTGRSVLAEMRRTLRYDRETGCFVRTITVAANARAGEVAGSVGGKGYRYLRMLGRSWRANRLVWLWMTGHRPPGQVDHANGNRLDDRWDNLRLASNAMNCANARRRRDNSSGTKGVKPLRGRWQARIGRGGAQHLGTFDALEEARAAYEAAARRRYGAFARAD